MHDEPSTCSGRTPGCTDAECAIVYGTCHCGCGAVAPPASKTSRGQNRVKGKPSRFLLGHGFKGRSHTLDVVARIVAAHTGAKRSEEACRNMSGACRSTWKGDDVSYYRLHAWVARWKPRTNVCTECGVSAPTDWANISGEYRRDLDDFREMCRVCHRRFDMRRNANVADRGSPQLV